MFVVVLLSDCVRSSGVEYRGAQQSSSSGLTCLNWTNVTRNYDVLVHPDSQTGKQLTSVGSKSTLLKVQIKVVLFLPFVV